MLTGDPTARKRADSLGAEVCQPLDEPGGEERSDRKPETGEERSDAAPTLAADDSQGRGRRQTLASASDRARTQGSGKADKRRSEKGLFYVPYRAVSTSPVPNSLGFPDASSIRDAAKRSAALSDAVGDEPFGMVIAPGVVRLVTGKSATEANVAFSTRDFDAAKSSHPKLVQQRRPEDVRSEIKGWSAKSRSRMIRVLAELDYTPLLVPDRLPAMITLTYPGDWLVVAPSANSVKRVHFKAFAKRWQRSWGEPLRCVWKLEFQRRGAPHLHLFTIPPIGLSSSRFRSWAGMSFGAWLSATWADIVNHPDAVQRRRHEQAGTAIDYAEGITARDPKRLAVYFAKHSAPSLMSDKEYQHHVPKEWSENGETPGRFWGVMGLEKATSDVALTEAEFVRVKRTLRRWSTRRSYNSPGLKYPSKVEIVTRVHRIPAIDKESGRIRRYRTVRRRSSRMDQQQLVGGYVLANQGPQLAEKAVRALLLSKSDEKVKAGSSDVVRGWKARA